MTVAVAHQHSPTGEIALTEGAREATLRGSELVVINIVETLDLDSQEALQLGLTDEIQAILNRVGQGDVRWRLRLAAEDQEVAAAIIAAAQEENASLLVIGARKRSPLGKFLIGSATQTIILDAPMPVLVVKVA